MTNLGYTPEEPIAAIATALNPGAIGIVRASGKGCIDLVQKIFSRPEALRSAPGNTLVYGWILSCGNKSASDDSAHDMENFPDKKDAVDQVMLGVYRAPKSFTGEDMVELFCHGGVSVVKAVLDTLLKNGFRLAQPGEFTFRAYINGKTDLTRAEAVREIIESKTDVSRSRAAGRLAGNLFKEIDSIKKTITDTLAAIEVEIEYPEDEENIADSFNEEPLLLAKGRLSDLVSGWRSEKIYQDGARVVLCGKTNAGKSSLFNALLKEERAIVSPVEGTTRDWLESWASFCGVPARLFDTAGLRATDDVIEAQGVERAKDILNDADVILYLADSRSRLDKDDMDFMDSRKNAAPVILVWNKCDAEKSLPLPEKNAAWSCAVSVSARTGQGMGALSQAVKDMILGASGTERLQAGLGSERQKVCVAEALERVEHALSAARGNYGLDAVVQDLEDALDSLGEVTGAVTPDDVLGTIFANFCVGK